MPPPLLEGAAGWLGYCGLLGGWAVLVAWAIARVRWATHKGRSATRSIPRVAIRLLTFLLGSLALTNAFATGPAPPDVAVLVAAVIAWAALAVASEAEFAVGANTMGLCIRAGASWAAALVATSWYTSCAASFLDSSSEHDVSLRRKALELWSITLFLAIILAAIGLRAPGRLYLMSLAQADAEAAVHLQGAVDSAETGPPSPEPGASLLDLLTFGWVRPVLVAGRKAALEFTDIFELVPQDRCEANAAALAAAWTAEVAAAEMDREENVKITQDSATADAATSSRLEAKTSVLRMIIVRCCGRRLLKLAALRALAIVATFAQPLALGAVISSVGAGGSSENRGNRARLTFTYAFLLFALSLLSALLDSHCSYAMQRLATQQRLGLQRFLFEKALKLSGGARQMTGTGAIISHLQVDCRLVSQGVVFVNQGWSIPLQLTICLALLYQQLGAAAFAGLGITALMSPLMFICARAARRARRLVMKRRDARLKFLTELLQGARSLKLFAWEMQVRDRVSALRSLEVEAIQSTQLWGACTQGLANAVPLLVAVVTFAAFAASSTSDKDGSGNLTPSRAFVSLALLGLLGAPLAKIPIVLTSVLGMLVAAERLKTFLHAEEFAETIIEDVDDGGSYREDDALTNGSAPPTSAVVFAAARSPIFKLESDLEAGPSLDRTPSGDMHVMITCISADTKNSPRKVDRGQMAVRQRQYLRCLSPSPSAASDAAVIMAGGDLGATLAIGGPASFAWPAQPPEVNSASSSSKAEDGKGGKRRSQSGRSNSGNGSRGKGGKGKGNGARINDKSSRGYNSRKDPTVLRGVAFSIPKGSLVAVVGRVGSGKSSLLAALLHELEATEDVKPEPNTTETVPNEDLMEGCKQGPPRVAVCGSVAFCAQEPWIQNATLRHNICFGRAFDAARYATVVDACALLPDLQQLPDGDHTQIGERGLTLSGGQKARVALARALYVDADVFLLDDVLAAVDRHVQRHLLQSIILPPHGLLRRTAPSTPDGASGFGVKTVVVVTNQLDWIPSADFVIALGGGGLGEDEDEACRVLAWGRPRELLEAGVDVAEIVREDARKAAGATPEDSAPEEESPINTIAEDLKSVGRGKVTSKGNDSKKTTTNDGFEIGSATAEKVNQAADSKTAQAEKDMRTGDEMRLKGAVKKEIWVGYARALGAWWSVLLILLYTVAQLSRTGGDLVIANWSMASSDADSGATSYLTLYAISTGLAAAVVFLRAVALVVASLRAAARAHDRALWATLRSPMAFFDTTTSGRVLNRFSSDMQLVDMQLRAQAASLLGSSFQLLAGLAVVAATAPAALLVLPPLAFVYLKLQRDYRRSATEVQRLQSISRSPVLQQVSELIAGLATVRAFRCAATAEAKVAGLIDRQARVILCSSTLSRWLAFRLEVLGSTVVFAVGLSAGITDATTRGADAALVGLSLSYALQFTSYLNGFLTSVADMELGLVAMERLHQYAKLPSEAALTLPQPPLLKKSTTEVVGTQALGATIMAGAGKKGAPYDPPPEWPSHGAVVFKGVSMRFRSGLPEVLKCLSFDVAPGEKIGIVGRTGSGKSSLLAALFRLPIAGLTAGAITIDGVDIAAVGLHTLRKRVSIVPQDPVLLSGSLRANLDPFGESPDANLKASLLAVGLWDVLMQRHATNDGENPSYLTERAVGSENPEAGKDDDRSALDFAVSAYGENLSVGQRQLLCIARALLRKCKVAVLDEATAAIDKATDELIQHTLAKALGAATVLTVAHRLETIALSDKVLVMHHGTAAEFGHPRELLADPSSHFHALWHGRSRKPKETFTQGGFDPNKTNFDELERRLD